MLLGSPVPAVEVDAYERDVSGPIRVSLPDLRGEWVVLFFYPRDFTFVCPTELRAFADLEPEFAAEGARVLAASTDSFFSHKAWFESESTLAGVRYPILADTSHELADAFGVLLPDGAALRGTFIVDPQGTIRHAVLSDLNVGRSAGETLRSLQALKTGELCPAEWRPGDPTLTEKVPALA